MVADLELRAASVLLAADGLGFGIPCIMGIRNLAVGRGVLFVLGFPTYGGGPFERFGMRSSVPLLVAYLVVCGFELLVAALVWRQSLLGGVLALAVIIPGAIFWYGFALPIPPIFAIGWTALILTHWSKLS